MSDMDIENASPQTIRLSSICVEDYTTVLEVLLCQRLPFNLSDSSWARGPFGGYLGLQPIAPRVRPTTLGNSRPLFPDHGPVAVLSKILQVSAVESYLISFNIHPSLAIAKYHKLLFLFYPSLPDLHQVLLHVLNGFVVGVQDAANGSIWNPVEKLEKQSTLSLERCMTATTCFQEDGMQMASIDPCMTSIEVAPVLWHPFTSLCLKLRKFTFLAIWAPRANPVW